MSEQSGPGRGRHAREAREQERYLAYLSDLRAAGLGDREAAEEATAAVLCVLERHLPGGEARRMLSLLPAPLVALQRPCERYRQEEAEAFERPEFLSRVAEHLDLDEDEALPLVRAILLALRAQLSEGEARRVAHALPASIRSLWSPDRPGRRALQEELARYATFLAELHASRVVPDAQAEQVAQVVLCTLEERLSGGEASDVLQGLPLRLRQLLTRCRRTGHAPAPHFGAAGFLGRVGSALGLSAGDAEAVVRTVLAAARKVLPPEEVADVTAQLPEDLKELWLSPVPSAQPHA